MQHVAACFVHPQPFNYVPFPLVLWKELGSACPRPRAPSGGACGQRGPSCPCWSRCWVRHSQGAAGVWGYGRVGIPGKKSSLSPELPGWGHRDALHKVKLSLGLRSHCLGPTGTLRWVTLLCLQPKLCPAGINPGDSPGGAAGQGAEGLAQGHGCLLGKHWVLFTFSGKTPVNSGDGAPGGAGHPLPWGNLHGGDSDRQCQGSATVWPPGISAPAFTCPRTSSWSYWLDWSQTWFSPSAASPCDRDVAPSLRTNTLCPVLARVPCLEWGSPGRVLGGTGDSLG